jgi:hypothetical protein
MSTTFTIADDYDRDGEMSPNADPAKRALMYLAFIFGGAILYEPTTGDLSTLSEFGASRLANSTSN